MKNLTTVDRKAFLKNYVNSEKLAKHHQKLLEDFSYANAPDDDPLNPWKDNEELYKGHISRFDAAGLQIMSLIQSKVYSETNPPSTETKALMQQFLIKSMGNMRFNSFLRQDSVKNKTYYEYSITSYAIDKISYYTFKSRNLSKISTALVKLDTISISINTSIEIFEENKLTLKEFGAISDLAKIYSLLENINSAGFLENNSELKKLYDYSKKANEFLIYIERQNAEELYNLNGGIILLDDFNKHKNVLGVILDIFEKITNLFIDYRHAAMMYNNPQAKNTIKSHVDPSLTANNMDINRTLYANMFQVDPTALILPEKHKALYNLYGENWKNIVREQFKKIDNDIHLNVEKHFSDISVPGMVTQALSGLANLIPFGHTQVSKNDFEEIHHKVKSNYYAKQEDVRMLCSEFISTTLIASFVELDQKIKEDAQIKYREEAESKGFSKDQEIIKIPFGKHEDLTKVHPDRLLHILQESNCVQKITPKVVSQFIKSDEPKSKVEKLEASRSTHSTILVPS